MVKFTIQGQLRGGKNNMGVSKYGHHYPLKAFVQWRNMVMSQLSGVSELLPDGRYSIKITYFSGDRRRRDIPAMVDGLYHVFERSGLVNDDSQFVELHWLNGGYDKANPRAEIEIGSL